MTKIELGFTRPRAQERRKRDEADKQGRFTACHHPGDGWFIIEAAGQHATRRGEVEFTQNLTPEVLAGIVEAGVPSEGLPIDRDHLSLAARAGDVRRGSGGAH